MIDKGQIIQACQFSGAAFGKLVYPQYQTPTHILKIWEKLEAVARGEIKRLILTAPPRHGKSKTVSEIFPAWFFGHNPSCEIILGSFAQGIASRFGRNVKNLMLSREYASVFPRSILSKDSKSKAEFATVSGGEFHAAGLDGQLTSKGGDLIVLDDTIKNKKQAVSQAHRQSLIDFFEYVAELRLAPGGRIVLMHTRWDEDDLIGYILKNRAEDGWEVLNMPALDASGDALWPQRWSAEYLRRLQKNNPKMFEALYQQNPTVAGGDMFKSSWWKFYAKPPENFQKIITSWDLTFDENHEDDEAYTVGQVWGFNRPNAYLLYEYRKQAGFNDQIKAVRMINELFPRCFKHYVEKKANGAALIEVLQREFGGRIEPVNPTASKEIRAEATSQYVQNGSVYLPDPAQQPWVLSYIKEHATFPNAKIKDRVDATSQALYQLFGVNTADWGKIYG